MKLPDRLIKLEYSEHARERLIERTTGSLILAPQYIRLTEKNTIDVIEKKGRIVQATAHIEYKKGVEMYLPIILSSGIVKTVYFRNVKKKSAQKRIETTCPVCPEDTGTETGGDTGITQNVGDVPRNLGRKENRWTKLLRVIREVFRK